MADSIVINTQTLIDTAGKIRNINNNLDTRLRNINAAMDNLKATWKSDAGDDIRAAMKAMEPHFEEYKKVVEYYARFLDETARSYESTETAIQTNANAFR